MNRDPYRLFDYYRYEDRDLFFGREEEVARLVGDILSARLLVLFAPSGSGKSSLLRAGVQAALEKRGCEVIFTRVGEDPVASIVSAVDPTAAGEAPDLVRAFQGRTKPVVVVIDQFEELFLHFKEGSAKRRAFPEQLEKVIYDPSLRVYFVLSMRADFFVRLNEFRAAIPTIFHNNANMELRPFGAVAARDAIIGPAAREGSGFTWEKDLPERIVRDLQAADINPRENGVLPITLQIVCHTLWRRLPEGRGEISAQSYEAEGGAAAIIERRIFRTLEATPQRERRLLCRVLRELITKEGTKRIVRLQVLREALDGRRPARLDALLERFETDLLLCREESRGETWVELRHDYLASRMKPWIDEEEDRLDARRRRNYSIGAATMVLLTAAGMLLGNSYRTYTAEIRAINGQKNGRDELVVTRQLPFPRFRVETGFNRWVLQDGGIDNNHFEVPRAPTDWSAISDHLGSIGRSRFVLATRVDTVPGKTAPEAMSTEATVNFDALAYGDIGHYAAADDQVLSFIFQALDKGNEQARSSAAKALGLLGSRIAENRADEAINKLLVAVKEKESSPQLGVNSPFTLGASAALALGNLGDRIPEGRRGEVIDALLEVTRDRQGAVQVEAIKSLGKLAAIIPEARLQAVVEGLLGAPVGPDFAAQSEIGRTLGFLLANVPPGGETTILNAILHSLKPGDSKNQISRGNNLGGIPMNVSRERADAMAGLLLNALKEGGFDEQWFAAMALTSLGSRVSPGQAAAIVGALLKAYPQQAVWRLNADPDLVLENTGRNIPEGQVDATVEAALATLATGDRTYVQKMYALDVLAVLGKRIPAPRQMTVFESLFQALKGNEPPAEWELWTTSNSPNFAVELAALRALEPLAFLVPPDRAGEVTELLLTLTKLPDGFPHDVQRSSGVASLGALGSMMPPDRVAPVLGAMLAGLKNSSPNTSGCAARALCRLRASIPPDRMGEVVGAIFDRVGSFFLNRSPLDDLGTLGDEVSPSQKRAFIEALMAAAGSGDDYSRANAVYTLGGLGEKMTAEQAGRAGDIMVQMLQPANGKSMAPTKLAASVALGRLAPHLPEDRRKAAAEALLGAMKDIDNALLCSAGRSLGNFRPMLSQQQVDEMVIALAITPSERAFLPSSSYPAPKPLVGETRDPQPGLRLLTRGDAVRSVDQLIDDLQSDLSQPRLLAVNKLPRRSLTDAQRERIRALREDKSKKRPWVRIAALDALMEIEREKADQARDHAEAEEKARNLKAIPPGRH